MVITDSWFYPVNQGINHTLKFRDMDLSWMHQFKNDRSVFYLVNIQSQPDIAVPDNKDLYVLGWFFEPFDGRWFLDIYNRNPQAQFIIMTDLYPNDFVKLSRVEVFCLYHHTTWLQAIRQANPGPVTKSLSQRQYKISALSARLSEFKFYVTAKLLEKNDPDVLCSWNRAFEIRDVDDFIFTLTNFEYTDRLIQNHQHTLRTSSINAQEWCNAPLENCFFGHDAYTSTVVNCVNETQSLSFTPEFGVLPLPYLTEKTWKPLFAGNAVLLSSQALSKKRLEHFGFRFDYPWACNFDEEIHDIHRYNTVLNHIDWLLSLDKDVLIGLCRDSIEHNVDLAWSDRVDSQIAEHNAHTMQQMIQRLGIQ